MRSKEEESFSLSVNSGEVKVTSKQNMKSVYVKAGETAFFSAEGLKTVQTTDFEPLADYLRYVHFKDQNIANIVRIVNQRMGGLNLNIDPKVGDRFLTITLSNESPEEIARLICLALKLTYINKEEGIYITLPE